MKLHRLRDRLKESTRAAVLEAAERVFAERGAAARMEDLAAAAGVAVGTLYNYFADRDALLEDLLAERRRELWTTLNAAQQGIPAQATEQRLVAFLTALLAHIRAHWGLFTLILLDDEAPRRPRGARKRSLGAELHARASVLTRAFVERGVFDASAADLYPAMLLGMLKGVVVQHMREHRAPPPDATAARVASVFLRGAQRGERR
jgi:AcrR family transcriptional regulator